jgi:TrmH family RNA methyltransferase
MLVAQDGWITSNPMAVAHWTQLGVSQSLWRTVTESEMSGLATTNTPPGVIAVMASNLAEWGEQPELGAIDTGLGLLLWVSDPGNLGTMLRLAWASGIKRVWLNAGTVDIWNPKVVRAAAGAHFHLPWAWVADGAQALEQAQVPPERVLIADPHEGIPVWEAVMQPNALVVMGHETNGLPNGVDGTRVRIPMPGGAESLNVAMATGILLYEAIRPR